MASPPSAKNSDILKRKAQAGKAQYSQSLYNLKDEVKEAEKIRKSVYSIMRQEQHAQQPHRTQDMDL